MDSVKRGLFWFRNDLRLEDNPALNSLCDVCDEVVFVYIIDPTLLETNQFDLKRLGAPRWLFIKESLHDLEKHIQQRQHQHHKQQNLIIKVGKPTAVLTELISAYDINHIGVTVLSGVYEKQDVETLKSLHKDQLTWHLQESFTLFDELELPFLIDDLPDGFTPFRKKIEKAIKPYQIVEKVVSSLPLLPSSIDGIVSDDSSELFALYDVDQFSHPIVDMKHKGGELFAKQQLDYYCHTEKHLSQYKETRNGLDGWDFSSKLSAYLALGCVSPRQVMQAVVDYEKQYGANQSTYWLYFELLWREFYQWHQVKYQSDLYLEKGIQGIDPRLRFDQGIFETWVKGETKSEFVNAFMKQLKLTGWMSNRGRQIVASYFINQLGQDWRYGAAWFEEQLIDYDPASNWGNWQYLAGVGVDPRGRRAFNIEKQREMYDPDKVFIECYIEL